MSSSPTTKLGVPLIPSVCAKSRFRLDHVLHLGALHVLGEAVGIEAERLGDLHDTGHREVLGAHQRLVHLEIAALTLGRERRLGRRDRVGPRIGNSLKTKRTLLSVFIMPSSEGCMARQ